MKLVACPSCRTQFDVTALTARTFACRCGGTVPNAPPAPVEICVLRCASCGAPVESRAGHCTYCTSPIVRDGRRLSLICPHCYARCPDDARFCTGCATPFRPESVPCVAPGADDESLRCPTCAEIALASREVGGIVVHECPGCAGLFVPGESFDTLVDRAIAARRAKANDHAALASLGLGPAVRTAPRLASSRGDAENGSDTWKVVYRRCPGCRQRMQRRNYGRRSGIIVDLCSRHGTWLEADELFAIASFIASGGLDRAPPDAAAPDERLPHAAMQSVEELIAGAAAEREKEAGGATKTLFRLLEALLG